MKWIKCSLIPIFILILASCGGGGGTPPPDIPQGSSNWDSMTWDQDNWSS